MADDKPGELCRTHNRESHCSACVLENEKAELLATLRAVAAKEKTELVIPVWDRVREVLHKYGR